MILADVNILIYALRNDAVLHHRCRTWLESVIGAAEPFAVSPQVLSSVVRVATNPKIHARPTRLHDVLAFGNTLLDQPHSVIVHPGPRHWSIFCDLCHHTKASGNLIPGAWFAALAIEHGCEWITDDRDYARFPGLRWRSLRDKSLQ